MQIQYCEKVMQTIIDEYREYRRYLTIFYFERYIERYLIRAIVSFLRKISLSLCEISFPVSDISLSLCDILFPLRNKSFPLSEISFQLHLFRPTSYRCGIVKYMYIFPKIIYDNDKSSSLRSQLFEMAGGVFNVFNVCSLSLNYKHV